MSCFRDMYTQVITEYFDITDRETRNVLLSIDENDQNSVLLSLTQKLYSAIIDKTTEIDFGDIPETKGDVTMLESYTKLVECITTITKILQEYKQPTDTIDEIRAALDNIENQKMIYQKGFLIKSDIIMTTYNTIVLAIVNSISYMISCMIEFIKNSHLSDFRIIVDKAGVARTKDSLVYQCLIRYNEATRKGEIDAAFKPLIKARVKNVVGALALLSTGMAICTILMNIIPIIRELVYFFFAIRTRISNYFDIQADLLEMNIELIKSGEISTVDDKRRVIERQQAIATRFRKTAEMFAIKTKEADKKATRMIKDDSKNDKINDVVDHKPDSSTPYGNTLF